MNDKDLNDLLVPIFGKLHQIRQEDGANSAMTHAVYWSAMLIAPFFKGNETKVMVSLRKAATDLAKEFKENKNGPKS